MSKNEETAVQILKNSKNVFNMLPTQSQVNSNKFYYSSMPQFEQNQFIYPPPSQPFNPTPNRFIYVKNNFTAPAPKVLVNPHFRKTVYVNPQFQSTPKPKIHVNPEVLKNLNMTNKKQPVLESPKRKTVISTKNKLVRVPCNTPEIKKRRNSLHTKYKIVRSGNESKNKFKLDKREKTLNKSIGKSTTRKKYVYVNRFLSMNVIAKNVVLKKRTSLSKSGFVNINGILYKKSPNSLRKASTETSFKSPKSSFCVKKGALKVKSQYKLVRKETSGANRKSLVRRYKVVRSAAIKPRVKLNSSQRVRQMQENRNKLRKCNIPCPIYRKYGKCPGKEAGKCIKIHNPDQIAMCTRFLQGACRNTHCLLSHKVSQEKMPTCKYFLEGLCSKDDCPYLHVKISPKAEICRDFVQGFCKNGAGCDKRHQFLCPDFEKNKKCLKRRCPYPHGNAVRKTKKILNTVAKKCSTKKDRRKVVKRIETESETGRYYKENSEKGEQPVIKTMSKERPKLGALPAYIPLFEET